MADKFDRGRNPHDGSRRRLGSVAHDKRNKRFTRAVDKMLAEQLGIDLRALDYFIPEEVQDYLDEQSDPYTVKHRSSYGIAINEDGTFCNNKDLRFIIDEEE